MLVLCIPLHSNLFSRLRLWRIPFTMKSTGTMKEGTVPLPPYHDDDIVPVRGLSQLRGVNAGEVKPLLSVMLVIEHFYRAVFTPFFNTISAAC